MKDNEEITFVGILILLVRIIGFVALLAIPIFVIYKLLKWLFE